MKLSIIILICLLFCSFVFAQNNPTLNPVACETLGECFDRVATLLLYVAIGGVSVSIIVAGGLFLTGGTPAKIALAKKIILWGIGIFVIMLLVKLVALVSKNDLTSISNP